jgi:hypothetical protein
LNHVPSSAKLSRKGVVFSLNPSRRLASARNWSAIIRMTLSGLLRCGFGPWLLKLTKTVKLRPRQSSVTRFLNLNIGCIIGENKYSRKRQGNNYLRGICFEYYPAQPSRSKLRNWIASARCSISIFSLPARSAMVRATFRIRS